MCVCVLVLSHICMQLAQLPERSVKDAKSVVQEVSGVRGDTAPPANVSTRLGMKSEVSGCSVFAYIRVGGGRRGVAARNRGSSPADAH